MHLYKAFNYNCNCSHPKHGKFKSGKLHDYLCLVDFTKTANNVALYQADKTVTQVESDFQCAALCRREVMFDCKSFDYCPSAKKCQLSKKHSADSGPATRQSDICDHYSSKIYIKITLFCSSDFRTNSTRPITYKTKHVQ